MANDRTLLTIDIDLIDPNPENPRIVFRQEELDTLLYSISKFGVQVPISVYKNKNRFVLIDGERRLKVSKKLNLKSIPAIIQDKPDELGNLLLMFNIHALREQWDYFTIAQKLPRIIDLYNKKYNREPNEIELSRETGLTRGIIRRCMLLIKLPDHFKKMISEELVKPKNRQILSADFFLEMEQALKTVKRNYPDYEENLNEIRDTLIDKYKKGTFNNITDLRLLQKIATSSLNTNISPFSAKTALDQIFYEPATDIVDVYENTVGNLYDERRIILTAQNIIEYLENIDRSKIEKEFRNVLIQLKDVLDQLLEDK